MSDDFPMIPIYVPKMDNGSYDYSGLTLDQLKECWIQCELQKAYCHEESCFQPLIDQDMRRIKELVKKIRHSKVLI